MAVLSKLYRLPLLLGALCCLVALALIVQWYFVSRHEQELVKKLKIPAESALVLADPPVDSLKLEGQAKFQEIMTRPLFIKARTPLPETADTNDVLEAPVPQATTELGAKFSGYIEAPGGKIALVKDIKTRKYHRLQKGEQVNDWTLTELSPDKLVFKQGDAYEEVLLRVPKVKPNQPKTGRPHRVMRPATTPMPTQKKPKLSTSGRRKQLMNRIDRRAKKNTPNPQGSSEW